MRPVPAAGSRSSGDSDAQLPAKHGDRGLCLALRRAVVTSVEESRTSLPHGVEDGEDLVAVEVELGRPDTVDRRHLLERGRPAHGELA